jgi:CheY-like chemotaxis protein
MVNRLRLLIVDDEVSIRQMLRQLVEDMNGGVIGEAENGLAGVNAAERLQPDVLLLDVSMPVMGGFEAARQLHKSCRGWLSSSLASMPIMRMLTKRSGVEQKICAEAGSGN